MQTIKRAKKSATADVARALCRMFGDIPVRNLFRHHAEKINDYILKSESAHTRSVRSSAARRIISYLHKEHGAEDLGAEIIKARRGRPRNITATADERARLLSAAAPYMRCWLLLCSDLAIRSGTACRLTPEHYDAGRKTLTFTTKYESKMCLPVTKELGMLLETKGLHAQTPYVAQLERGRGQWRSAKPIKATGKIHSSSLSRAFTKLKEHLGIRKYLRPHDLRRTTATRVYDATKDLRLVQALLGHQDLSSTLWYLDHGATPVGVEHLELAKLNPATEAIQ